MALITTGQITVAATATLIYRNATGDSSRLTLHDPSNGGAVFLGTASVTDTTGFEIEGGDTLELLVDSGDSLYGIVSAGTQVVTYISFS